MDVQTISLNKIKLGNNSRLQAAENLEGLMQSIKEEGLLEPIGLIKTKEGNYTVSYGNRRFLAVDKLGWRSIPAIIHEGKSSVDDMFMNLSENLQRRDVSITEMGRYFKFLREDKNMSNKEIAVRLGITENFIKNAMNALARVPSEFIKDLEVQKKGKASKPGKITLSTANAITSTASSLGASKEEVKAVFNTAKKLGGKFKRDQVNSYFAAARNGKRKPDEIASAVNLKAVNIRLSFSPAEYDEFYTYYVTEGPYSSFAGLVTSMLRGEVKERFKTVNPFNKSLV